MVAKTRDVTAYRAKKREKAFAQAALRMQIESCYKEYLPTQIMQASKMLACNSVAKP